MSSIQYEFHDALKLRGKDGAVRSPLSEAVRNLRRHFHETQQQFAGRIGSSPVTVARWESSKPPRGAVLLLLERLAHEIGNEADAKVFQDAAKNQADPIPVIQSKRNNLMIREQLVALIIAILASRQTRPYSSTPGPSELPIYADIAIKIVQAAENAVAQEKGT